MSPKQQRITIADVCGWSRYSAASTHGWIEGREEETDGVIPDYLNDLNACAEFEKVLDETQKERYVFWLNHLHPSADIHYSEREKDIRLEVFSLVSATTAQRCEAFLRVRHLWAENLPHD